MKTGENDQFFAYLCKVVYHSQINSSGATRNVQKQLSKSIFVNQKHYKFKYFSPKSEIFCIFTKN